MFHKRQIFMLFAAFGFLLIMVGEESGEIEVTTFFGIMFEIMVNKSGNLGQFFCIVIGHYATQQHPKCKKN